MGSQNGGHLHCLSHIGLGKMARAWRTKDLCGSKWPWTASDRDMDSLRQSPRPCCSLRPCICRAHGQSKGEWHMRSMQSVFVLTAHCCSHILLYSAPHGLTYASSTHPHCGPGWNRSIGKSCQTRRNQAERNMHSDLTSVLP